MKKTQVLLVLPLVMLAIVSIASADVVVNGKFAGNTGWTNLPYNAAYSCDPDGTGSAYSIGPYMGVRTFGYQDVSVSQNTQYEVSWKALSESSIDGQVIQWVKVEGLQSGAAVEMIQEYTMGLTNTGYGNWIDQSFDFNSGSYDSVRLTFDSGGSIYKYYRFDNVSMDVVPEPATMALLGLGGLASLRRRRE